MTHLLHRIPMGRKFLLTLLLPLLALAWFAGSGIVERQRLAANMVELESLTVLAQHGGNLVHEMQRERGMTAGYLGSQGSQFGNRLAAQRIQSDQQIADLRNYLSSTKVQLDELMQTRLDRVHQLLSSHQSLRQRVDSLGIDVAEAIGHYTRLNEELITMVARMTQRTDAASITRGLSAYYTLLEAKELAGIERAVLANAFSANIMRTAAYQQLLSLIGEEAAFLKAFDGLADQALREQLAGALSGPEIERLAPLRQIAVDQGVTGMFDVDPQQWFDWQTVKIERLRNVENFAADQVATAAASLRGEARQELVIYAVITALAIVLAMLFAFFVVRSLVRSLRLALEDIESRGGDLTRRLPVLGTDEINRLYQAFNVSTDASEQLLANIRRGALSVEVASGEIAQGNQDLAQRTEEQSASLVETASSMEQITATVRQTADNAHEARAMTSETAESAKAANEVAMQASEAMHQIHTANQEVTSIVTAIDNIAFQTNLLALNASVEAARAGEHGRGFAVVAQEVRKLASRSAEEAQQIRRLIDTNVTRIAEGERLVRTTGETLANIMHQVEKVAELVAEMASATGEQSAGIEQINQAVSQLEEVTQQNAALVEQVAAASRSLDDQASDMAQLIGQFKVSDTASLPSAWTPSPSQQQPAYS
ncbi:MAG: nitrate- and nitrite sensing domain-containing protein [Halomonas sp.]|uniref:methyl-accepting chemotaxis protein n=1 Tax=Halomonas sp. TaxID=1486246 RepID=UPI003971011A